MTTIYSLDASIVDFLSTYADVSREECDALAESLLGTPVQTVPIQGTFSYTVANDTQIVQFRAAESPIDTEVLEKAHAIHGSFVARTVPHGHLGLKKLLSVYTMEKLPGATYIDYSLANCVGQGLDDDGLARHTVLVEDLARFFAASWYSPQEIDRSAIRQKFECDLQLLARSLPLRFSSSIVALLKNLDFMIESLPGVLNHGDLSETNFLVDPSSGHLNGVIDWAEAEVLPFGCSLWGLENILGYMNSQGWHYFDQANELRAHFWNTLRAAIDDEDFDRKKEAVNLVRQAGILFRYGFQWVGGTQRRVANEDESNMRYLDALIK